VRSATEKRVIPKKDILQDLVITAMEELLVAGQ
jgi:hypothetical protein